MKLKLLFILALVAMMSCSKEEDPTNDNNTDVTDNNVTDNDDNTTDLAFPKTYIVVKQNATVDPDTLWLVTKTKLPDPNFYRYQINFGTKAQLQQNAEEVGQNSTVGFVMTYKNKPANSTSFDLSSSRFLTENTAVNFYLSFFNNTGYSIVNKNYLSPNQGQLDIVLSGANFSTSFDYLEFANEADNSEKINIKGVFDFEW